MAVHFHRLAQRVKVTLRSLPVFTGLGIGTDANVGVFQGMFENTILTFSPGWNQ